MHQDSSLLDSPKLPTGTINVIGDTEMDSGEHAPGALGSLAT